MTLKWTSKMQPIAEVCLAMGVSANAVGRLLGIRANTVLNHMVPGRLALANEKNKQYQRLHREQTKARNRRYEALNREIINEKRRQKYWSDIEKGRARSRANYYRNREKCLEASSRYYQANKERYRQLCRDWDRRNPLKVAENGRRRKARVKAAGQDAIVPVRLSSRQQRVAIWRGACAYCGAPNAKTMDHVLPLKFGGLDEPCNIIPACKTCNSSKSAKPMEEWYRRQPFFTEARLAKIRRHTTTANGQLSLIRVCPRNPRPVPAYAL